ncbi:hypothetical protein PFNF54_01757 [Plasmodium falciparum NF54]|uniref:Erythrocyte membrane protein 1 n=1 Tax=Plasmodium falciparum (isolate NF54) TaxID=5843 RepID=W7KJ36_PLAFO|nr:hypothetical protein PFNF54_01757 [Plasmodium falciparum NF54]
MARPGSGGGGSSQDAKHVLDEIGQQVHDQVEKEAKERSNGDLKGNLTISTIFDTETTGTDDPCSSDYTTRFDARGDPCKKDGTGNDVERFSVKQGAECGNSKIHGNSKGGTGTEVGACAPYRRLNLCNKNLENINKYDNTKAKHDLLAEVCHAAKYEGASITLHYPQYQNKYDDSGSTMCTMLARSFADIGDIIRGKDLYLGKKKKKQNGKETEREKLEDNLRKIFENIKKENNSKLKSLTDDQIREYWWTENRETVWKAMTCSEDLKNSSYFHATCIDGKNQSQARNQCRCPKTSGNVNIVPTYFDYVPQYLRWFEEWAEDFCRKKKKKVQNLQKQCRDKYQGDDRYCSRNGYDCEQTINKKGKLVIDKGCINCLYACNPYVDWINNQKEQFDKQVKKYGTEISDGGSGSGAAGGGGGRKKRGTSTTNYDGYESKFYKIFKGKCGTVDAFLGLLNNEKACKEVKDGGKIHFEKVNSTSGGTAGSNKTFYHSEYCQPCPLCGVKKKDGGNEWEKKKEDEKCNIKLYKPKDGVVGTTINFLYSGDETNEIEKKLKKFCRTENGTGDSNSDPSLYDPWQCYHVKQLEKDKEGVDDPVYEANVKNGGGLCILPNPKKNQDSGNNSSNEPEQFQKTFNNFFNFWVAHMLKDSIYWRTKKLVKCLKNGNTIKCGMNCKDDCGCFKRWVEKKQQEWGEIKEHFGKQDFGKQGENGVGEMLGVLMKSPSYVLKFVLEKDVLLTSIKSGYGKPEDIERIEELLKEEKKKNEEEAADGTDNENKTTIDKLLKHELTDAKDCQQKCDKKPPPPETPARNLPPPDTQRDPNQEESEEEEEEEDEDAPDDGEVDGDKGDGQETEPEEEEDTEDAKVEPAKDTTEDTEQDGQGPPVKKDEVNPCDIVSKLFQNPNNFSDACTLKYVTGKNYGWKCVSSGNGTTSSEGRSPRVARSAPSGDKDGAICVPPRRRRLYVGRLTKWAESKQVTQPQEDGKAPLAPTPPTSSGSQSDPLLTAFVESAAIETFFLWHKYKVDKIREEKEQQELFTNTSTLGKELQDKLERGNIPTDFLRQMFYTLGDYRDILFSGSKDAKNGVNDIFSGDKEMKEKEEKIKGAIQTFFENGASQPPSGKRNDKHEEWWKNHGEHIWNGMICALTYKDNDAKGQTPTQIQEVRDNLWDSGKNEPKKPQYQYQTAKLEEKNSGTKPTNQTPSSTSDNTPTTLTDFISRPPYFRYLEEWGQNFCKERKKRLAQIKHECMDGDTQKYSGDGEYCEEIFSKKYNVLQDLSSSCAKPCRLYKTWIEKKKTEYEKQKKAYEEQKSNYENEQKDKCQTQSNNNANEFSRTLGASPTAAAFLNRLGSCKNDNVEDNGEDKLDFNNPEQTFRPATNCGPCPVIGVKCKNGNCSDTSNGNMCKGGMITAENINNSTDDVSMLVSDNSTTGFNGLDEACQGAGVFEGIKEDKWKCGTVCGVDICTLEKKDTNGQEGDKKYITMKELLKRWLEYFFEDYNRIQKKLKPCTKSENKSTCIKGCVEKWIDKKKEEWKNINNNYLQQYKYVGNTLTNFLEILIPKIDLTNDKKKIKDLPAFLKLYGCNCADNSQNSTQNDVVLCLLENLKTKAKKCEENHKPSGNQQQPCQESPSVEDDEEDLTLEETEENTEEAKKKMMPTICETVVPTEPEEPGETCTPAAAGGGHNPEQTPVLKPEEEAPTPEAETKKDKAPVKPPSQPTTPQIVDKTPALVTSTLAWSVGIGFAAKKDFISNMLQNEPNDIPNDYSSGDIPFNTQPNTLYFDNNQEKPFIMSIHDRNLYTGEEYNYNVNMSTKNVDIPMSDKNDVYSGIDLINDSLNSNNVDIYDEVLKRKENELFGTNHPKHTNTHSVTKSSNSDPIDNQLNLFHKWLDRHRDMCEQWNNKEKVLDKLKEEWNTINIVVKF